MFKKIQIQRFFSTSPHILNLSRTTSEAFSTPYDAIIVGAGHNGLITSSYLAQKKMKILILERRELIGGAAVSEELYKDHLLSRASYVLSLLRKKVIEDLFKEDWKEKLVFYKRKPSSFTPFKKEGFLVLGGGKQRDFEEISKFSKEDARKYEEYNKMLRRFVDIISPLIDDVLKIKISLLNFFLRLQTIKTGALSNMF